MKCEWCCHFRNAIFYKWITEWVLIIWTFFGACLPFLMVNSYRDNGSARDGTESLKLERDDDDASEDHKRKVTEVISEVPYPNKTPKKSQGHQDSTSSSRSSHKQHKREKLDWNVLRPPKPQKKSGWSQAGDDIHSCLKMFQSLIDEKS